MATGMVTTAIPTESVVRNTPGPRWAGGVFVKLLPPRRDVSLQAGCHASTTSKASALHANVTDPSDVLCGSVGGL